MKEYIKELIVDEGFDGYPYIDPRLAKRYSVFNKEYRKIRKDLKLTIGYGTLLPLTKEEAIMLLDYRINKMRKELEKNKPFLKKESKKVKSIVYNMMFNLGVPKLLKFKKMWKALENQDYAEAAKEMKDSNWYRQVGNRAKRLVKKMEALNGND